MIDNDPIAARLCRMAPLGIPQEYAEGVSTSLDILAAHVAILSEIDLPGAFEPAPVFCA